MNDPVSPLPFLPRTPREALGPSLREQVFIDDQTFVIERPSRSDRILDHPAVNAAIVNDGYMPYWAELWPAARMLAKWIVRNPWPGGNHALEIGCGLGLPGIAALSRGVRVTFSDYDLTALEFAAANARLNRFTNFDTLPIDWRHPPAGVTFPVILAADLTYEPGNIPPLVGIIKQLLAPDGVCLLTDLDRIPAALFRETLTREGMPFTSQMLRAGEPGGRRLKGTLYIVRLAS
ncbi:MAG: methyltransferase [Gemmataceae bacterium]